MFTKVVARFQKKKMKFTLGILLKYQLSVL